MENKKKVNQMSPLTLAYIGDAIYELYVREHLVRTTNLKPNKLHREAIKYVRAKSQAEILESIQDMLSEEEKDIVRRGRNAQNHHLPKNTELKDYTYATAFEALIGYLYLSKEEERLNAIMQKIIKEKF